jgi:hypothetical protein
LVGVGAAITLLVLAGAAFFFGAKLGSSRVPADNCAEVGGFAAGGFTFFGTGRGGPPGAYEICPAVAMT